MSDGTGLVIEIADQENKHIWFLFYS
jgi:hypothetical protein